MHKLYRNLWFWTGVLSLIVIIGLFSLRGSIAKKSASGEERGQSTELASEQRNPYVESEEAIESEKDLDVYELTDAVDQSGNRYILGKLRSKSAKKYTYVELNFSLHDASQNTLEVVTVNTMGLDSGATWEFRASVENASAVQYRLARAFGW